MQFQGKWLCVSKETSEILVAVCFVFMDDL